MYFCNKILFSCFLLNLTFLMIDNLIFDPMKQIWINLELYFKRYEFYNFYGFFLKNF